MGRPDGGIPGLTPPPKESAMTPERRSLKGLNVVITGVTGEIGRDIALALATEGVGNIVGSFHQNTESAGQISAEIAQMGVNSNFVQTDLSKPEGRDKLATVAENTFGEKGVYAIFLNGSGQLAALNLDTSKDLLGRLVPRMNKDSAIVLSQSTPAHWYEKLSSLWDLFMYYKRVARVKQRNQDWLMSQTPQLDKVGIKVLTLTAGIVQGTKQANYFDEVVREKANISLEDLLGGISSKLGIPNVITSKQMADKAIELLTNPNIRTGYTELFGNAQEVFTLLKRFYGPQQVYVDTVEKMGEIDGQKVAIVRSIVSKEQAQQQQSMPMVENIIEQDGNMVGVVNVKPEMAYGHFRVESELPGIIAGHEQIRAAIETVSIINGSIDDSKVAKVKRFAEANFLDRILADSGDTLHVVPTLVQSLNGEMVYDVVVINKTTGNVTAEIKGLAVEMINKKDDQSKGALTPNQLVEAMAQATGVTYVEQLSEKSMPVFLGIGPTEFYDRKVRAGDGLQFITAAMKFDRHFAGEVLVMTDDGEVVAKSSGVKARITSKRALTMGIKK